MCPISPSQVDLTNCDREPIHIPGAILPHGAMVVVDCETGEVVQAAGDTTGLINRSIDALLGQGLETWLRPDQAGLLRELCADATLSRPRHLLDPQLRVVADQPLDASVHRIDGLLVIEFEAADLADRHARDPIGCVQEMLENLDVAASLQDLCQIAADRVRAVAGYDRVMVYRFMEDDTGWVFAESRQDRLVPFLDLHYPAADIPKQARALYVKNPLRLIAQVDYTPAPLVPRTNPRTGRPLDMSHATLRDVSPIHREYLRNMGVDASMSISIVRDGRLWGLIACHHYGPRRLPRHLRAICELFGAMFSLHLEARQRAERFDARLASRTILQQLMGDLAKHDDYGQGLINQARDLLRYIPAGGLALRVPLHQSGTALSVNSLISTTGATPDEAQIAALIEWLTIQMDDGGGIFVTDRLGELWEPAKAYAGIGAGLLAVAISRAPRDFILWFRPEVVRTVAWGGDPSKPVELGPRGDRLTPRKSFDVWKETVLGRAAPWGPTDTEAAFDLRVALLETVLRRIDAAAQERERTREQEHLLMAELDHRVKNMLANIQALVAQTSRSAESLSQFTEALNRRITSMAKAHGLLTQSRWDGVSMRSLLLEQFAQYGPAISMAGPNVMLAPKAALALSLAAHELATNAAKYGALSTASGRVAVDWEPSADAGIVVHWRESGGPAVRPPKRRGFGLTLIERALAMETQGRSTMHFDPGGFRCEIVLPAVILTGLSIQPSGATVAKGGEASPAAPGGKARRRILIVEDSALVAMSLERLLEEMGWEMVGPAMRVKEAMALVSSQALDGALIDVNLNGEMAWDVASALKKRGVPFAFSTGYDGGTVLPPELADSIVVGKPFHIEDVRRRLYEMIGP